MGAITLDGKATRDEIFVDLKQRVAALTAAGRTPGLGTILVGDLFTLGSDSKQYVVTAAVTVAATTGLDLTIYPALSAAASLGTTLAVVGSTAYTVNMAFHPLGWAFASRPFNADPLGVNFQLPVDPVSGVALRLEVARQYKQTTFSYDALWGTRVIRRELGCKIFG